MSYGSSPLGREAVGSRVKVAAGVGMTAAALLLLLCSSRVEAQEPSMFVGVVEGSKIMLRATVASIDMQAHTISLLGPQGEQLTLKVDPSVNHMEQLKPGDNVNVKTESVAVSVTPY